MTAELKQSRKRFRHVLPGFAFDLTVNDPSDGKPWDFSKPEKRERARRIVREQRPYMLIGSPMCTDFSTWQHLNESKTSDLEAMRKAKKKSIAHIEFMVSLYLEQYDAGRYFLHEHPRYATSWQLRRMAELMAMPGVELATGDQCQYGSVIRRGARAGDAIKKPTGFLSNSEEVRKQLSRRCEGVDGLCSKTGGKHALCSGIHAKDAAKYPRGLCRAILQGVTQQLRADELLKDGCYGLQAPDDEAEIRRNILSPERGSPGKYRDDLTGQPLKDSLVQQARAVELQYFHAKGVWVKVPKHEQRASKGRRPISVRWVDVNKGDEQNPNYRSRLVARQLKATDKSG